MNRVLVIVVTYNSARWVDECFGSLRASEEPVDVIAIDNASSDGTPDLIAEHFPEVYLVRGSENIGFGAGNNIGLRNAIASGYDYVYLLNADAWVGPGTIGCLIAAFEAGGHWGILSPVQKSADGGLDPRFNDKCSKYLRRTSAQSSATSANSPVQVPFVMAAHWMISSECLSKVGLFSPAFDLYGEDNNYIDRAKYHGFAVGVVPGAEAVHDRGTRPNPVQRKLRLKCSYAMSLLQNPRDSWWWRIKRTHWFLVRIAFQYRSHITLDYLAALRPRYPELKKIRALTKKEGAFIEI